MQEAGSVTVSGFVQQDSGRFSMSGATVEGKVGKCRGWLFVVDRGVLARQCGGRKFGQVLWARRSLGFLGMGLTWKCAWGIAIAWDSKGILWVSATGSMG